MLVPSPFGRCESVEGHKSRTNWDVRRDLKSSFLETRVVTLVTASHRFRERLTDIAHAAALSGRPQLKG